MKHALRALVSAAAAEAWFPPWLGELEAERAFAVIRRRRLFDAIRIRILGLFTFIIRAVGGEKEKEGPSLLQPRLLPENPVASPGRLRLMPSSIMGLRTADGKIRIPLPALPATSKARWLRIWKSKGDGLDEEPLPVLAWGDAWILANESDLLRLELLIERERLPLSAQAQGKEARGDHAPAAAPRTSTCGAVDAISPAH